MASWTNHCPNSGEPHVKSALSCPSCNAVNPNPPHTPLYMETIDLTDDGSEPSGALSIQTQRGSRLNTYSKRQQIPSAEHLRQTSLGRQPVRRASALSRPIVSYKSLAI